ncbi:hypothetical protein Sjap_005100 [Stephania japonica]|uniref:Uncharacterized protein n=1 Tax=Stephania japonica TaxID=461633 RepID=A0AAP0K3F8_9MAGN
MVAFLRDVGVQLYFENAKLQVTRLRASLTEQVGVFIPQLTFSVIDVHFNLVMEKIKSL